MNKDYKIAHDLSIESQEGKELAKLGFSEISIAEKQMPGIKALLDEYGDKRPLEGARIAGCLHMTSETAVLIKALIRLGASVRWSSCNIFSTYDPAAAAIASLDIPVFAWKGMSLQDYEFCIDKTLFFNDEPLNLMIDDGGDLTRYVHDNHPNLLAGIKGVSEETTTGVRQLYKMQARKTLGCPAINVNDAITKSKFDNFYGCRESLIDGIKGALNCMIAGKNILIAGYGDVGKGCAESMRALGAKIFIAEIDPIAAYQACMEGYTVTTLEKAAPFCDIFITATGCREVITGAHMEKMKDGAVLCNIGHFDVEIDVNWLNTQKGLLHEEIKPDLDRYTFEKSGKTLLLLAKGRLVNLASAKGHPSFVMSNSFSNQLLAQIMLWTAESPLENKVYRLPRLSDEKVARLHLPSLGAELTTLSKSQAEYLGVAVDGPYKPEDYRY